MKEKREKPYIDYKTAKTLAWMRDFIVDAIKEREKIEKELNRAIIAIEQVRNSLKPIEGYDSQWAYITTLGYTNDIARLSHDAWEAGLTQTLFEKLGDKQFWNRFTGWLFPPVLKEEIQDKYEEEKK